MVDYFIYRAKVENERNKLPSNTGVCQKEWRMMGIINTKKSKETAPSYWQRPYSSDRHAEIADKYHNIFGHKRIGGLVVPKESAVGGSGKEIPMSH